MDANTITVLLTIVVYLVVVIAVGFKYAKTNDTSDF